MYYLIIHSEQRKKFSISDEVIDGRPLYLDAQATTPLVRRYLNLSITLSIIQKLNVVH